jgi:hypothetical protein
MEVRNEYQPARGTAGGFGDLADRYRAAVAGEPDPGFGTGSISMLEAYWLVPVLRVTHSLEIFADEIVYAGALTLLLGRQIPQPEEERILVLFGRQSKTG